MNLRPYQKEDMEAVAQKYYNNERRLLGVWPTGVGKTVALSNVRNFIPEIKREVILVNRDELVEQTVEKLKYYNPGISVGVEKADQYHNPLFNDAIVASVQTVGSTKEHEDGTPIFNKRLCSIDKNSVDAVIVDETHHLSGSKSWQTILKYFGVFLKDPQFNQSDKLLLGLTATPNRSDNKGLEDYMSSIAFSRDLRWAIENKWLVDLEPYRVITHIDISDVKITAGDFDKKQLAAKVNTPQRNKVIAEKYQEIAPSLQGILFTVDVQHAHDLAEAFREVGIKAQPIYGDMPKDERRDLLQRHKRGDVQVLMNAMVLTEGYDDPSIQVVGIARPTKSGLLYRQMVGRGLRPNPAPEMLQTWSGPIKKSCTIIDFVDVSSRHSLITAPTLFGLNPDLDLSGKHVLETLQELEEEVKKLPPSKQSLVNLELLDDLAKLSGVIEKIDLLNAPVTPDEVKRISDLSWFSTGSNYNLPLMNNTWSLRPNTLGKIDAFEIVKGMAAYKGTYDSLDGAIKSIESKIPEDDYSFARANSKWRKDPPTQPQLELIAKLDKSKASRFKNKVDFMNYLRENMTKGEASQLISQLIQRN